MLSPLGQNSYLFYNFQSQTHSGSRAVQPLTGVSCLQNFLHGGEIVFVLHSPDQAIKMKMELKTFEHKTQ